MTESWKIQTSVKTATGALINLRADNPQEAEAILKWATENAKLIVDTEAAFVGTTAVAAALPVAGVESTGQPWGGQQAAPPAFVPQPQAAAPAPAGKVCQHGPMVYREAKPGSGKSWKAYFCPTPQNTPGQCKPEFL